MSYSETIADGTILGEVPGILPKTLFRDRQELRVDHVFPARGLVVAVGADPASDVLFEQGFGREQVVIARAVREEDARGREVVRGHGGASGEPNRLRGRGSPGGEV